VNLKDYRPALALTGRCAGSTKENGYYEKGVGRPRKRDGSTLSGPAVRELSQVIVMFETRESVRGFSRVSGYVRLP